LLTVLAPSMSAQLLFGGAASTLLQQEPKTVPQSLFDGSWNFCTYFLSPHLP
jgi:hypothetical protein